MEETKIFRFKQCINILKASGKRAGNLRELRDAIAEVSENSIYHHTCQYFLREHSTEYTNDFAKWIRETLKENILAERLSSIDPYEYKRADDVRLELLRRIDDHLVEFPQHRQAMPGEEFYFNEAITIVSASGIEAKNLAEFFLTARYIDVESIYYHFYEARIRLGKGVDDFSKWVETSTGDAALVERLRSIDIFMHNLESVRGMIVAIVEETVKREMEKFTI